MVGTRAILDQDILPAGATLCFALDPYWMTAQHSSGSAMANLHAADVKARLLVKCVCQRSAWGSIALQAAGCGSDSSQPCAGAPAFLAHVPILGGALRGICVRAVKRLVEVIAL